MHVQGIIHLNLLLRGYDFRRPRRHAVKILEFHTHVLVEIHWRRWLAVFVERVLEGLRHLKPQIHFLIRKKTGRVLLLGLR